MNMRKSTLTTSILMAAGMAFGSAHAQQDVATERYDQPMDERAEAPMHPHRTDRPMDRRAEIDRAEPAPQAFYRPEDDREITERINEKIVADPEFNEQRVFVEVRDGVAHVQAWVDSPEDEQRLRDLVAETEGVDQVEADIELHELDPLAEAPPANGA